MAQTSASTGRPRRSSWLRKLLIILASLVLLLIALYFVVTSSAFLKAVVLPRAGGALNAKVEADQISLSPFSEVVIERMKVQTTGAQPVLAVGRARVRYSLGSILRGRVEVGEITLESPAIYVEQNADGTSNLDPIVRATQSEGDEPSSPGDSQISIRNIGLKNATIAYVQNKEDRSSQRLDLTGVNLTIDQLQNNQLSKIDFDAQIQVENRFPAEAKGTNSVLQAGARGSLRAKMNQDLAPESVQGSARLDVRSGTGSLAELNGLSAILQTDLTPTDIKEMSLRFEKAGQALGQIALSGPFDLNKTEGRVQLAVQSIDRQVLNLVGAGQGWDFQNSKFNSTNLIEITNGGARLSVTGRVAGTDFSVRQGQQTMPALDVAADYQVRADVAGKTAVVEKFSVTGQQEKRELLSASLDRPMSVSWGGTSTPLPDSTFQFKISQLELNKWQPVLGTNVPGGRVDVQLTVRSEREGKQLAVQLVSGVRGLEIKAGTAPARTDVRLTATGQIIEFKQFDISQYQLDLSNNDQSLIRATGSAQGDADKATLRTESEIGLPALLAVFPQEGISATNGMVRINAVVNHNGITNSASGTVRLASFSGKVQDYVLRNFASTVDYNVEAAGAAIRIHKFDAALQQDQASAGTFSLTGNVSTNQAAQVEFKAVNLNQHLLGPLLGGAFGDKKLTSAAVNGSGSLGYNPSGEAAVKAQLSVTNLVVVQPGSSAVPAPLAASLTVDGSSKKETFELRQFLVALSPTARAQNQLQLTGRVDMAKSNAVPSQLALKSDSLDLSAYYELFAGGSTNAAPAGAPAPAPSRVPGPAPRPGQSPEEPAPIDLPIQQLTADVRIGKLFVRDLVLTNLHTTAVINRGEVTVKPLQFSLNGAPVNATALVNLSVPGYQYDVALQATNLPIQALVGAFDTNAGAKYKGELIADAKIKGAGTTGANLQKSLAGNVLINATNLNLEIVGPKLRRLLDPIALVLRLPELTQTPLNWVAAKAQIGQGTVNLTDFSVQSQAFFAQGAGTMRIAEVLTNSPLDVPVTVSLRRSLAEKAKLVPANTPTNAVYVALPSFAKMTGTLGAPKTDVNELVITGLLLQSAGNIPNVGGKAGTLLQGIGGILSGQRPVLTPTNAPPGSATNQPAATNKTVNPFDLFKLLPKKGDAKP